MKKGDVLAVGDRSYVVTGVDHIGGESTSFGEMKRTGPVRKVTLYVGLDRGRSDGKCAKAPASYDPELAVRTFLSARAAQVTHNKVAATVIEAKGRYEGNPEDTRVFEVLYKKSANEKTFAKFRHNILKIGEHISEVLCQERVLATVKNGKSEDEWDLTPRRKVRK